mmetsp:Transcript_97585/g.173792  ORF Transcript_97585/g.173792 Transcript_97585/m.173792 type:complete len:515 (-) Transcript_97585:142-1686(-)|eukprot:CAMPEP_0197626922 /NCGR_PEP_ID=MMETSP1338-20131121/5687_1 /TAXON_ID=43686 ORGANISM="Pelagodinium beii, Strain RCC1491" /NCGR_SAMPLE_ID=MMETSP1338 /ASSEMBLY_ACC=CAM_ASM_000754 /LENGTH=514 /DNA_ID=CAMNT_0043197519 /DNA_START=49 /DNA_END=1593 /DNA_ORIENTATION=-
MATFDMYGQAQPQCQVMLVDPSGSAVGIFPAGATAMWGTEAFGMDMGATMPCMVNQAWMTDGSWQAPMMQTVLIPNMGGDLQTGSWDMAGTGMTAESMSAPMMKIDINAVHTDDYSVLAPNTPSTGDEEWACMENEAELSEGQIRGKQLLAALQASSAQLQFQEQDGPQDANDAGIDALARCSASALRRKRRQKAATFASSQWEENSNSWADMYDYDMEQMPAPAGPAAHWTDSPQWQKNEELRCARLSADLEAGGERMSSAAAEMKGHVRQMSGEPAGCRVVQLALAVLDLHRAQEIVEELHDHVREAIGSPHGNYVIQKVVELMPHSTAQFVVEEIRGSGAAIARHRFGCRIICRLMEQSGQEEYTASLVDEVLEQADDLCRHSFGHHAIQSILEHGLPRHQARIAASLCEDLRRNAKNRNASYVIEKALTYSSEEDRKAISSGLLSTPEEMAALAQNQFGAFVVRALLRLPGECGQEALEQLKLGAAQQNSPQQASKYLCRLLEEHVLLAA